MQRYNRLRHSLYWDETECLNYYGMLSLHEIFEIVGSQLTETDIEVLSFLLDETFPGRHPLDPAGWTAEIGQEDQANAAAAAQPPGPALLNAWRRIEPRGSLCPIAARHRPKSGTELLLELEKRGYLSEESLEPLLQLLRVLTRHDLLHLVSRKKRRTDFSPPTPEPARKKRKRRGHAWSIKGQKTAPPPPEKVSCAAVRSSFWLTQDSDRVILGNSGTWRKRKRVRLGNKTKNKFVAPLSIRSAVCVISSVVRCLTSLVRCPSSKQASLRVSGKPLLIHNEGERTDCNRSNHANWYRERFCFSVLREGSMWTVS